MQIVAEYRMMQDKLISLMDIADAITKEIETIEDIAENLDVFWDGLANDRYLFNISAGLVNAKLIVTKIKRKGYFLSYALSRYQASEREISEMIYELY